MHLALVRWRLMAGQVLVVDQKLGQHLIHGISDYWGQSDSEVRISQFILLKETSHILRYSYWCSSSYSLKSNHFGVVLDILFIKDKCVRSFWDLLCEWWLLCSLSFIGMLPLLFLPLVLGNDQWHTFTGNKSCIMSSFLVNYLLKPMLSYLSINWNLHSRATDDSVGRPEVVM